MADELQQIEEKTKEEYEQKARENILAEQKLYTEAIAFDQESFERSKEQIKIMEKFQDLLAELKVVPTNPQYEFEKDARFVEINTYLYNTKIWQQLNELKKNSKLLGEQIAAKQGMLDKINAKLAEGD